MSICGKAIRSATPARKVEIAGRQRLASRHLLSAHDVQRPRSSGFLHALPLDPQQEGVVRRTVLLVEINKPAE